MVRGAVNPLASPAPACGRLPGANSEADVSDMAKQYSCEVVVVVPQDKAWDNDPFAESPEYRLAENRAGRWRIYMRVK